MSQTTIRKLPRFVLALTTTCCSLLIAACGSVGLANQQVGPPPGCHGAECNVNVNVQNCVVSADPPTIPVPQDINVIKWTIQAPDGIGYHFPQDGITIKNPGSGITPNPGVIGHGTMFVMHDDHTVVHVPIPYSVLVMRDSTGVACPLLDPIILNQ